VREKREFIIDNLLVQWYGLDNEVDLQVPYRGTSLTGSVGCLCVDAIQDTIAQLSVRGAMQRTSVISTPNSTCDIL
jgi:hypothetical protein